MQKSHITEKNFYHTAYTYKNIVVEEFYDATKPMTYDDFDAFLIYAIVDGKSYRTHRMDGPAVISDICSCWYVDGVCHRDYGPAVIWHKLNEEYWFRNNESCTNEILAWIKEHNYPNWQEWDDAIRTHFKLTFL